MAALFPSAKDYSAAFAEHPVEHRSSAEVAAALAKAIQEKQ